MFTEVFYALPEDISGSQILLRNQEAHHVSHVLRKKMGDTISIVDGLGTSYLGKISTLDKHAVSAEIMSTRLTRYNLNLTLALGIPKRDKFEWVLEKGSEIGVTNFVPLLTERTLMKTKSINLKRCNSILISAMKQSCRSILPHLENPTQMTNFFQNHAAYDLKLIAHEKIDDMNLKMVINGLPISARQKLEAAAILIGPEGGFTEGEVAMAVKAGYTAISLGKYRLRTETAAIVAITLILDNFGNPSSYI